MITQMSERDTVNDICTVTEEVCWSSADRVCVRVREFGVILSLGLIGISQGRG